MGNTHTYTVERLYLPSSLEDSLTTTLIVDAAGHNNVKLINYLLDYVPGVNINFKNDRGNTALIEAVRHGNTAVAEFLLAHPHVDPNVQNEAGNTALMEAISLGYKTLADSIMKVRKVRSKGLNLQNNDGNTALHLAVLHMDSKSFNGLLNACANVNIQNYQELSVMDLITKEKIILPYFKERLAKHNPSATIVHEEEPIVQANPPEGTATKEILDVNDKSEKEPDPSSKSEEKIKLRIDPDLIRWLEKEKNLKKTPEANDGVDTQKKIVSKRIKKSAYMEGPVIAQGVDCQFEAFAAQFNNAEAKAFTKIMHMSHERAWILRKECVKWLANLPKDTLEQLKIDDIVTPKYLRHMKSEDQWGTPITLFALINVAHVNAVIITDDPDNKNFEFNISPLDAVSPAPQKTVALCHWGDWHYSCLKSKPDPVEPKLAVDPIQDPIKIEKKKSIKIEKKPSPVESDADVSEERLKKSTKKSKENSVEMEPTVDKQD